MSKTPIKTIPTQRQIVDRKDKTNNAEFLYYTIMTFYPELGKSLLVYYGTVVLSKEKEIERKILTTIEDIAEMEQYEESIPVCEGVVNAVPDPRDKFLDKDAWSKGNNMRIALQHLWKNQHGYMEYKEILQRVHDERTLHEFWFI